MNIKKITNEQENFYRKLADEFGLNYRKPHISRGRKYFQIYPKNTPKSESVVGAHYEFGIEGNNVVLALHLENKIKNRDRLKQYLNIENPSSNKRIFSKTVITNLNEKEIRQQFKLLYDKYENKINEFYLQENKKKELAMPQGQKNTVNQILYGPPGTGKTYYTINKALEIIFENDLKNEDFDDNNDKKNLLVKKSKKVLERKKIKLLDEKNIRRTLKQTFNYYRKEGQIEFITFHQSYAYEEFVEGIKPQTDKCKKRSTRDKKEDISYCIKDGIFKRLCNIAKRNEEKNYILIIDEINRGNISKIFGELITLIEDSKRLGENEELSAILPYSNETFGVPKNLYIVGTMNTADRSIAHIDTALRRRFEFVEMLPDISVLDFDVNGINIGKLLQSINNRIEVLYDREHTIGHSYFLDVKHEKTIKKLSHTFKNKVLPLLAEYFYSDWSNIKLVLNDKSTDENKIELIREKNIPNSLRGSNKIKPIFEINYDALNIINTYQRMIESNEQ